MWSFDKFGMAIIAATIHDLFLFLQQFTRLRYKKIPALQKSISGLL